MLRSFNALKKLEEKEKYNPSATGKKGSIFGLPFKENNSSIIIYPVPWDVTTSAHSGTANGPQSILDASVQLDLEINGKEAPWKKGIYMIPPDQEVFETSKELRSKVESYIEYLETVKDISSFNQLIVDVNKNCTALKDKVFQETSFLLKNKKKVGILGGDHSVPLGFLEALSMSFEQFGILQIDAHMDLRKAYEGFNYSHASIMNNALNLEAVVKLVQVGIRDYCEEEKNVTEKDKRVSTYYDNQIKKSLFTGVYWVEICDKIIEELPQQVYISFDIDGLDPSLCTGTGTPVPGGLSFDQAIYLLDCIKETGREVIGFDLCEVAPKQDDQDWNANVGARVLYHLCSLL
ncbi:MAG: agmatinase family protein [Reichenbachiella sp.]